MANHGIKSHMFKCTYITSQKKVEHFPQTITVEGFCRRIFSGQKRVCEIHEPPETKPTLNQSERTTRDLIVC